MYSIIITIDSMVYSNTLCFSRLSSDLNLQMVEGENKYISINIPADGKTAICDTFINHERNLRQMRVSCRIYQIIEIL